MSGFNGSTVREPWLCSPGGSSRRQHHGFNGSTVREPWLCSSGKPIAQAKTRFNGSTVREPWLCRVSLRRKTPVFTLQWVHGCQQRPPCRPKSRPVVGRPLACQSRPPLCLAGRQPSFTHHVASRPVAGLRLAPDACPCYAEVTLPIKTPRRRVRSSPPRLDLWEQDLPWAHLSISHPTRRVNLPVAMRASAC